MSSLPVGLVECLPYTCLERLEVVGIVETAAVFRAELSKDEHIQGGPK